MKNKTRNRLLTIVLAIAMSAVFMPVAALAEDGGGTADVANHTQFVAAIDNTEVTTINVTGDFDLEDDVEIGREVTITCLSDPGYTITTGDYSIIIAGSEAVVTISGNVTVTGQEPIQVTGLGTANVSGGSVEAAGEDSVGVYVEEGAAYISGGSVEATGDGSTGVYVIFNGTTEISGGAITVEGEYSSGVWVEVGTATVSGGAITAEGDDSAGVLVRPEGTADISGGTIEAIGANSAGVYVVNGSANISGDTEISGDTYGVYVSGGTAGISGGAITSTGDDGFGVYLEGTGGTITVSGGTITAEGDDSAGVLVRPECTADISGGTIEAIGANSAGVNVIFGSANISGDAEICGAAYGVYVSGGTAGISGGTITVAGDVSSGVFIYKGTADISGGTIEAQGADSNGVALEDSTATISGDAEISGEEYGVKMYNGLNTVTVSLSTSLTINGGVHNDDGKVFLTDLPGLVAMIAGETETVELTGVDGTICFEVDSGTDEELAASIDESNKDMINLAPPDTTPAETYTLALTAASWNTLNLIIPVTVAAPDTVINIAAIAGVTAPVRGAAPVTAITETDQYTGTVTWSPAVIDNKFAAETAYTATITLTAKTGYTLTGVAADFFTVEGATSVSNDADAGVITAVFPATEAAINIAAIAGVTAPVRGAAPVTAITETDQYTGTVSWSPAVIDNKFAAETAYTATISLMAKTGYTLSGVAADFFTVAGATATNAVNTGVITAVFPATAPAPDSGGDDPGDRGGGDDSSGPSNPPPQVNTHPSNAVITSGAINKETGTTPDGKTLETFTVQSGAASQIQQAKEEGKSSVEFNIASSQTAVTGITIPSTVLESASGMNVSVSTPHATLGLPAALIEALAASGKNLNLTVSRGGEMADPKDGSVLSTPTEITTDIVGETQVTIPLEGISIPADPQERAAFLSSLAVFTCHSDGETELITAEIIYDNSGNPVGLSFPVDKFSTFAVVKLSKRTVTLTIGSTAGGLNDLAVVLDAPAFVEPKSSRALIPLRFIGEALGAQVEWLPATRQVKIKDGEKEILLTLDSAMALVNGQIIAIDCAPVSLPPGRTFLPLRFIGEALGAEVAYDEATKGIAITREYEK